jgi:cyanophycinase
MGNIILFLCTIFVGILLTVCEVRSPASLGLIGDPLDVTRITSGGTVLAGGGSDVDEAFKWMISKSGGGDFVVIRASGTAAYNSYIYGLGSVNSVETLLINSRTLANDPQVEKTLREAEAVFIAGGDQANYVNYWKDSKIEDMLNYLRNTKQIPIGGTSAGCAILGGTYFSALVGTITSSQALSNPYNRYLTLGRNDFLSMPYLSNVITDTHFDNPDRRGRLVTFLARMNQDYGVVGRGIGLDEATAVCIESNGIGRVFGSGTAFFLSQNGPTNTPEVCVSGSTLDWYRLQQAVTVYKIDGSTSGSGTFDLTTWSDGSGNPDQYYYVDRGYLGIYYGDKK